MQTQQTLPKPGQRIECVQMGDDPAPMRSGSRGTVLGVQEVAKLHHVIVAWDCGRTLNMVSGADRWRTLGCEA